MNKFIIYIFFLIIDMETSCFYKFLDKDKLEKIKGGMFKNKSYSGYTTQVLKSGICKYYRRKMFDKFEFCVVDMLLFADKNKPILTNLFNRLKILLMEEIVYSELGPINQCIQLLENIQTLDYESQVQNTLQFCNIVKKCKRGRIISYINNYYKYNRKKENLDNVIIDKVLKFKKKNDSDELLKYGELFINYINNHNEKSINIYNILYQESKTIKCGNRYRRKEPIYLLFEIMEDFLKDNKSVTYVFNFCKEMFFRKNMIERRAFGVWIVCIVNNLDNVHYNFEEFSYENINLEDYFKQRINILINDDFVIKDYHVNKNYGLAKFGNVGSLVIDEDLSILGNNGEKLRQFYKDVKNGKLQKKKKIKFKVKESISKVEESISKVEESNSKEINNYDNSKLEIIPMDNFNKLEVLEEGVCGLKVCCLRVEYKGKMYILKEMRKSFNYGKDYMLMDELKQEFDIKSINMQRIKSNKCLTRIDTKKKTLVKNWKWETKETYYCKMELFENIGDLGKHKHLLENDDVFKECLKIRLYDGLFCSSDNILRNILVNTSKELLSIDEGDIYGKRKQIFNKSDWFLKSENKNRAKEIYKIIIKDWNLVNKISIVSDTLKKYDFSNKVDTMKERFLNYEKIVENELT